MLSIANVAAACRPALSRLVRVVHRAYPLLGHRPPRSAATGRPARSGCRARSAPARPGGRRLTGMKMRRSCGRSPCASRCRRRAPAVTARSTSFRVTSRARLTCLEPVEVERPGPRGSLAGAEPDASRVRGSRAANRMRRPVATTPIAEGCGAPRTAQRFVSAPISTPVTAATSRAPSSTRRTMPGRRGDGAAHGALVVGAVLTCVGPPRDQRCRCVGQREQHASRARCRRQCSGAAARRPSSPPSGHR